MATSGSEYEYRIKFVADQNSLQNVLNQLDQISSKKLNNTAAGGLTKQMKEAGSAANALSEALKKSANADLSKINVTALNQSLKQAGTNLQQIQSRLINAGNTGTLAFTKVGSAIMKQNVQVREGNKMLTEMSKVMANSVRYAISYGMFNSFTSAVKEAFNYVKKLDTSLNNIRIVTGETAEQMASFAKSANEAAKAMGTTTTTYTDAALIYYQQGLDDAAAQERTDVTVKLANVMQSTASEVSTYMTAIWNNFDDGSESLEHYADVITNLGAHTASSSAEIAQGLEKFAAAADTAGLSYEYATTALATVVATTRQSADTVGTAFKTLFSRIQDLEQGDTLDDGTTLGTYAQALEKVGVNIKDQTGNLKDMDSILDEIGAKWEQLSNDQQLALAENVAGVRQYTQFVALMDNWDFFKENLNYAEDAEGTLEQQQETYMESITAHMQTLTATKEELFSDAADTGIITSVIDRLADLVKIADNFIKSFGGGFKSLIPIALSFATIFSKQINQGILNNIKSVSQLREQMNLVKTQNLLANTGFTNPKNATPTQTAVLAGYKSQQQSLQQIQLIEQSISEEERNNLINSSGKIAELEKQIALYDEINKEGMTEESIQEEVNTSKNNVVKILERINELEAKKSSVIKAYGYDATKEAVNNAKQELKVAREQYFQDKEKLDVKKATADKSREELQLERDQLKAEQERVITQAKIKQGIASSVTGTINAIGSLSMAYMSFSNIFTTLTDDSMTFGQKFSSIFMNASMAIPMLMNSVSQLSKSFKEINTLLETQNVLSMVGNKRSLGQLHVSKLNLGQKLAILTVEKAELTNKQAQNIAEKLGLQNAKRMTAQKLKQAIAQGKCNSLAAIYNVLCEENAAIEFITKPQVLLVIAAVAAVAALVVAVKKYRNAAQAAYDQASEEATAAAEHVSDLKDKYDELSSSIDSLKDAKDTLSSLTKGTTEWREAVVELNSQIIELLDKYPQLAEYITDNDGVLTISDEGLENLQEEQLNAVSGAQMIALRKQGKELSAENDLNKQSLRREISDIYGAHLGYGAKRYESDEWDIDKIYELWKSNGRRLQSTADDGTNKLIDANSSLSDALGREVDFTESEISQIETLCTKLDANTEAIKQYNLEAVQQSLSGNEEYQDLQTQYDYYTNKLSEMSPDDEAYSIIAEKQEETKTKMDEITTILGGKLDTLIEERAEENGYVSDGQGNSYKSKTWKELAKQYIEESGEYEQSQVKYNARKHTISTTDGDEIFSGNWNQLNEAIAEIQVSNEIANGTLVNETESLIKSLSSSYSSSITKALTTLAGGAENADFSELTKSDLEDLKNNEDALKDKYSELGYDSFEELKEAIDVAYKTQISGWNSISVNAETGIKDIDTTQKNLTLSNMDTIVSLAGGENSNGEFEFGYNSEVVGDFLNELISDEDNGLMAKALNLIEETDFSSLDTTEIKEQFAQLGIDISDSMCQVLKDSSDSALQNYRDEIVNIFSDENYTTDSGILNDKGKEQLQNAQNNYALTASDSNELDNMVASGTINNEAYSVGLNNALDAQAQAAGYTADELDVYTKSLQANSKALAEDDDFAREYAADCMSLQKGIDTIGQAFEDYEDALTSGKKGSLEYAQGIAAIQEGLDGLIGFDSSNLSNSYEFIQENLDDIKKAAEGDQDAIERVQKAAATDIVMNLDISDTALEKVKTLDTELQSALDKYDGKAIGFTVNADMEGGEDIINNLDEMVSTGEMTAEQVNDYLDGIGWEPEWEEETEEADAGEWRLPTFTIDKSALLTGGQVLKYDTVPVDGISIPVSVMSLAGKSSSGGKVTKKISSIKKKVTSASAPKASYTPSSSSSSGSSSSDSKDDKEYKATLEKYIQQQQKIDDVSAAIDQLDSAKEHLSGSALAETLSKENDLLEQQTKAYKSLRKARIADAKEQQSQLKYYGFTFNDSGEYTNYDAMYEKYEGNVKKLTEKYNKNKTDANETALDKAQQELEYIKQLIDDYNDDWDEIANLNQEMLDNWYQELENNLEAYEAEITLHLDLDEAEVEWNDFLNDINTDFTLKYEDRTSDIATEAADYAINQDRASRIKEEMDFVWSERQKAANGKSDYFASATEAETKWSELLGDYEDAINDMNSNAQEAYDDLSDQIDDFGDQFEDIQDRLDDISSTLDNQADVVELLYGENSYDLLAKIYNSQVEVLKAQTANYQKQYEYWQKIYDSQESDNSIKQNALEKMQELQSDIESNTKDTVEAIKTAFENSVNQSLTEYQATAFGAVGQLIGGQNDYGYGMSSIDEIKDQWERAKDQADAYYDSVERVYQLNDLKLQYQEAIDSTDEIAQQKELTSLMNEQLDMLANKENLSETDIELAEKRLEVAKAQMELENAQNSKNTMQLVRDASGNYSYKYVANQSDVEEKTQALNDSINELYEAQKKAVTDAVDTAIDIQQQYAEAIEGVTDETKLQSIWDQFFGEGGLASNSYADMGYYTDEFGKGTAAAIYGYTSTASDSLNQFTDEQKELYQALADSGISSWSELWNSLDNGLADVDTETEDALSSRGGGMQYYWNTAMGNIAKNATNKTTEVKNAAKKMLEQIKDAQSDYKVQTEEVLNSVGTSYETYAETVGDVADEIKSIEDEQDVLSEKIEEQLPTMIETVSNLTSQWESTKSAVNDTTSAIESSFDSFDTLSQKIKTYTTNIKAATAAASDFVYAAEKASDSSNGTNDTDISGSGSPDKTTSKGKNDEDASATNVAGTTNGVANSSTGAFTTTGTKYTVQLDYGDGRDTIGSFIAKDNNDYQKKLYNILASTKAITKRKAHNKERWSTYETVVVNSNTLKKNKYDLLSQKAILKTATKGKTITWWWNSAVNQKEKKIQGVSMFDTGGYTGEWGSNGKAAILHEKELVLNKTDTSKILDAVELVRNISNLGQSYLSNLSNNLANGLQNLMGVNSNNNGQNIDQQVTINADFPNATNANEIEKALNNLTNIAIQHANS